MGLQSMESRSWTRLSDSACELLVVRWRVGSCSLSRDRTQPSVLGAWSAPPGRCQTPGVFIEQLPSLPTGPTARTQTRRHTRRLTHTCTCARTQTHMHTHTHTCVYMHTSLLTSQDTCLLPLALSLHAHPGCLHLATEGGVCSSDSSRNWNLACCLASPHPTSVLEHS